MFLAMKIYPCLLSPYYSGFSAHWLAWYWTEEWDGMTGIIHQVQVLLARFFFGYCILHHTTFNEKED